MLKILFWCLFIYFMYRLVFDLVIPISRTAVQFKRKVAEMQQQQAFQQQRAGTQNSANTASQHTNSHATTASKKDDYIEFEEVK